MKTRNPFIPMIRMMVVLLFLTAGCNKITDDGSGESSSIQQLTVDEMTVDGADDDLSDDLNSFFDEGGYKSGLMLPCNVTDSVSVEGDTIIHTLKYHGANCQGTRNRTGTVVLKMHSGQKWSDAGARAIATLKNFTVARASNNKPVILNGTITYVNLVGGRVRDVGATVGQVILQGRGSFSVTFDNQTTRIWQMARQRVFTGALGSRLITTTGLGSDGSYNFLVFWGYTRSGVLFHSKIIDAITHREVCNKLPGTGTKTLHLPGANNNTVTYGYNSMNKPVTGSECPSRAKLEWEATGYSGTLYLDL
ncbi:MAG: hypothetical protein PHP04_14135 [Bacteroidales bacterium]|nr:hypothetical protein [Bacteroidales bacterium]